MSHSSKQQLSLASDLGAQAGIFAPTIRHHNGWFYMATTNVSGIGNFYVRSKRPEGPWSEPILVRRDRGSILLFSSMMTEEFTFSPPSGLTTRSMAFIKAKSIITTGNMLTESRADLEGDWRVSSPEAPHLYKINGLYYLMIAEGGTEYGHMETIARRDSPVRSLRTLPL